MFIVDNFIENKKQLKILKDEKTWEGFPKFNWWDGWWVCKPRNTLEKVTLTAGSNISVTNSSGTLTIAGDYSTATTGAYGLMS